MNPNSNTTLVSEKTDLERNLTSFYFDNKIMISNKNERTAIQYTIVDLSGKIIVSGKSNEQVTELSTSTLANGLYILNLNDASNGISKSMKFIK